MSDQKKDAAKAHKEAPQDVNDAELDQATGGWGRTTYYSYGASSEASYTARSSDKGGSSS